MAIMSLLISFFRKNEIINYFYRMSLISYKFKKLGVFVFCCWKGFLLNILFICCCWTFLLFFGLIFIVFIWVFIFCLRGLRIMLGQVFIFSFFIKILSLLPLPCSLCCTLANTWKRWTIHTLLWYQRRTTHNSSQCIGQSIWVMWYIG